MKNPKKSPSQSNKVSSESSKKEPKIVPYNE